MSITREFALINALTWSQYGDGGAMPTQYCFGPFDRVYLLDG